MPQTLRLDTTQAVAVELSLRDRLKWLRELINDGYATQYHKDEHDAIISLLRHQFNFSAEYVERIATGRNA